jgi:hypothetical protein
MVQSLKKIFQEEGIKGYFKGNGANCIRSHFFSRLTVLECFHMLDSNFYSLIGSKTSHFNIKFLATLQASSMQTRSSLWAHLRARRLSCARILLTSHEVT